jgi:hypothetical protein
MGGPVKPPRIKVPPTLEVDEADRFVCLRVTAGMVWGGDQRRMNHALVTYAAELMADLRDAAEQPMRPTTLEALGQQLGIPPAELARMPGAATFYTSFFGEPEDTSRALYQTVFEPAGHLRSVAEAPGSQQLLLDYTKAVQGGAFYAGTMLLLVAMLAQRHPEVPASINRAIAIMEGWSARGLMRLPSDRTLLSAWKNWRHLAPLWAADAGAFQHARATKLSDFSAGLEAMLEPARLSRMLGEAKWFRSFATTFVPEHASAPLVPAGDALEIIAKAPEEEPCFAPLPPADLEAALRYRAPTRKFFGLA